MAIPDPKKWNAGYGYLDEATGMLRGRIRWPDGKPPIPGGCRWCGRPEYGHVRMWLPGRGFHTHEPPTQAQVKARMLARRRLKENK